MRENRTSGSESGDWKRDRGAGLRPEAKATETPPDPIVNAPVLDSTEERRRATKALRLTATGYQGHERIIDFRLFHPRMIRPVVGGGRPARRQTGVSQRGQAGFQRSRPPDTPHLTIGTPPRERGRPARMLSLGLPLSFPAMLQPTALPAGTAWARPKQKQGAAAG